MLWILTSLYCSHWASLVAPWSSIPLPMQETQVQPLGQEDPWRRKWQATPVFFAWKISWTEEPGRLQSMVVTKELNMTQWLNSIVAISYLSSSLDCELGYHHYVSCTYNIVLDTKYDAMHICWMNEFGRSVSYMFMSKGKWNSLQEMHYSACLEFWLKIFAELSIMW